MMGTGDFGMANETVLIPPPSIGESRESKAIPKIKPKKKGSKLWLVVLLCVVLGVGLGVFVYQQSVAPPTKPVMTPQPTIAPRPSPIPSPTVTPPEISQVTPQSNTVSFPKAGEIRIYYTNYANKARVLIDMESASGASSVQMVGSGSLTAMSYVDTGLVLPSASQVTVGVFDDGDPSKPGFGWIPPHADDTCGGDGSPVHPDITKYLDYATQQAGEEPLVSVQCWSGWSPNVNNKDTSIYSFNEYLVIWSYVPEGTEAMPTPTSTPISTATPTTTPLSTVTPTPTPTSTTATATPTPTPSPRVTMPEGSTLPEAGIFEITAGTMGIGLLLLILGLLGLLVL